MADEALEQLVMRLRGTAKYQGLCDDILERAAADALGRAGSAKEALKLAKRKLHQAFGAFLDASQRRAVLRALRDIPADAEPEVRRARLAEVAQLHASTAERIEHHAALWDLVREHAPRLTRVVDLGCGLAPALLPWSGLPASVAYVGLDLDQPVCEALERAVRPLFTNVVVTTADLQHTTPPPADVTLLWKLLPTLERQRAGSARALVERIGPTMLVATFPTRTLTGRDRGMAATYQALADRVLGPGLTARIGDELVRISPWPRGGAGSGGP